MSYSTEVNESIEIDLSEVDNPKQIGYFTEDKEPMTTCL